ncbi:hypothetical protein LTR49_023622 [Elasticomyces elasticus]|nr:hypothetical protein LTR49_023622 [Elasticomyces elasticus]KAK5748391.1 hypothetical protein LTS12_021563 [Elasticomyces elasticus]
MTSHDIQDLFMTVYSIRVSMMEHLTATDLATLCYALELSLTQQEKNMYLLPIRDLPRQEQWIKSRVENGARVTIMSKDLPLWLMRMRNPHEYWSMCTTHIAVRIWIIAPFSDEEQRKSLKKKEEKIKPMSDKLYQAWVQHTNPNQHDIDHWDMFSLTDWPTMPPRYYNLVLKMRKIRDGTMTWIVPPGCWDRLVGCEGGYLTTQRICNELQTRDQDQDEGWYACSDSRNTPTEIMYTPQVDRWYIDMDWMPNGLIDHSGTKIRTYTLSFPSSEEILAHVEEATEHLNRILIKDNMHVMIKGKQRSSIISTSRYELVIVV